MRLNALLNVSLLLIVIAAPIVDAIACEDCRDIVPLRHMQQCMANEADHADGDLLSHAECPKPQETGTARDLCPVCSDTAAAMGNTRCGAPSMIDQMNPVQTLIALSDPSYPIAKPPQS